MKRGLYDELLEAVNDINQWRAGKFTLKTYTVERIKDLFVTYFISNKLPEIPNEEAMRTSVTPCRLL